MLFLDNQVDHCQQQLSKHSIGDIFSCMKVFVLDHEGKTLTGAVFPMDNTFLQTSKSEALQKE